LGERSIFSVCCLILLTTQAARANDVEPRLYSAVPTGANFLSVGYVRSEGEVSLDSSIPVIDAKGEVDSLVLQYSRGLNVAGRSGLLSVVVPYANLALEGIYLGQPASGEVRGFGDPVVRLAVNFTGAPAMTGDEFRGYQQKTIVGASVAVSVPVGRYETERVLNTSSNRWNVVGQVGFSHRVRRWTLEGAVGLSAFSDNDELKGDNELSQESITLFRGTALYHFTPRVWMSLGVVHSRGGATSLNGVKRRDHQNNWRSGLAFSFPVGRRHRMQLVATEGVSARIGADFTTFIANYTLSF
jgi:hypothetical protein